jgi:hypothetical protein
MEVRFATIWVHSRLMHRCSAATEWYRRTLGNHPTEDAPGSPRNGLHSAAPETRKTAMDKHRRTIGIDRASFSTRIRHFVCNDLPQTGGRRR